MKPRLRLVLIAALGLTTIIGLFPVIDVVVAGSIAGAFGCELNEGDAHPCFVFGTNIGGLLYGLGVSGWLALLTWPLVIIAVAGWCALGIHAIATRPRR